MEKIAEICCGSFEDAKQAALGGAKRIELNSALFMGGLTPSIGTLKLVKEQCHLDVVAMVRPRGAGFCYSELEYETMLEDCRILLENGADGIAFGFLNPDCSVDVGRTKEFTALIHSYRKVAVFHRAFDCVENPYASIEQVIDAKVDRVLTSGLREKAWDGIPVIAGLQKRYGSAIQLLAGSGIHAGNAAKIMEQTGISQVHSSCKDWHVDPTTKGNHVSYAYACGKFESSYDVVSRVLVQKLVRVVERQYEHYK